MIFLSFLQSECVAIRALVEEFGEPELSIEEERKLLEKVRYISLFPKLKEYFETEVKSIPKDTLSIDTLVIEERIRNETWSPSLRMAIIEHMTAFEINMAWLIDMIESYRFQAEIEELVEIVRALDILGAERRLLEYEALLYVRLRQIGNDDIEWEKICGKRLPVNVLDQLKKFRFYSPSCIIGKVGSQRLIEYFLETYHQSNRYHIFIGLCSGGNLFITQWFYNLGLVDIHEKSEEVFQVACSHGHLLIAQWLHREFNIHDQDGYIFRKTCAEGHLLVIQWLYSLGNINIHALDDHAFQEACSHGHITVAQWLYSLGDVNIHSRYEYAFQGACTEGHFSIVQWLYSLDDHVDIHAEDDYGFQSACFHGHLELAQWLYRLGNINIHSYDDFGFQGACSNGYLSTAQWLYSLEYWNIHGNNDFAFRWACLNGHLSIAQWLYSLGGFSMEIIQTCCNDPLMSTDNIVLSWLRSIT
jgi:hypothetical protein